MKFVQGALIMYGSTGVCRVESIAPMPGSHGAEKSASTISSLLCLAAASSMFRWIRRSICGR